MATAKKKIATVNEYVKTFPKDIQSILNKIRVIVRKGAPQAEEVIAYGMPTFKLNGRNLTYFSAWKSHIGFYAAPFGSKEFQKELTPYQGEKGALRFPLDEPMRYDLIKKIIAFRKKELQEKKK